MPPATLGDDIGDLIIEFDSESGFEFRVQLEVKIFKQQDGLDLVNLLTSKDAASYEKAKKIVLANTNPRATPNFSKIIESAFDEKIKKLSGGGQDKATK